MIRVTLPLMCITRRQGAICWSILERERSKHRTKKRRSSLSQQRLARAVTRAGLRNRLDAR